MKVGEVGGAGGGGGGDGGDSAQENLERINAALARLLPTRGAPPRLIDAMRCAVLGRGKRLRPQLTLLAGHIANAAPATLEHAAAAVEYIHASSLVHDDLPAMDDDDLRRGESSLHLRFGEAIAILTGDALQAAAFATLAAAPAPAAVVQRWARLLGETVGAAGMAGGQVLDMQGDAGTTAQLRALHNRKTGALIRAAVVMGATAGALPDEEVAALRGFGGEIGVAFQLQDDILNAIGSTATLGKPQGSDRRRGKVTYVSLLGVDGAKNAARQQLSLALSRLAPFGRRAEALAALGERMVRRVR